MAQESEKKYVDLTPTWSGLLPQFMEWIVRGNEMQKHVAVVELEKMARAADAYVALNKKENKE